MSELIIHTRITPRKTIGNIVFRDRLTQILNENIEKNLILISSPAGYGKTTLIQDYLSRFEKNAAWYHVTDDITNLFTFINYIVHSLRILNNEFGNNVLEVIRSLKETMQLSIDSKTQITTLLGTFLNEFVRFFNKETILVIDDLHNIENTDWLDPFFNTLIENFPENFHIIITTRTIPQFNLAHLKAKRNYFELNANDLNFRKDEIERLLSDIYSMKYIKSDIELIEKKLNGWITGIHLILQAFGKEFKKARIESDSLPENLFNFFANDIFKKLDKDTQEFLLNTSLLDNFNPEICNRLLSINNSKKIISSLVQKNIFVEAINLNERSPEIEHSSFNYHALFKQYLSLKLRETKTEKEINNILQKIAEYYIEKNDLVNAADYLVKGKNYSESIPLIKKIYQNLFEAGRFEVIWRWFDSFPEHILIKDSSMQFYKGMILKYYKGDRETSIKYFSKVLETPKIKNDINLFLRCTGERAECLTNLGKPEEAVSILMDALEMVTTPLDKVKLLFFLADSYYRIGYEKYGEIIKILNEALEVCNENGIKFIPTEMHNLLGNVYQDRGEFIKSLFYFELAERNETNIYKKIRTMTNIVMLCSYSGNYTKSKEYLDKSKELYKSFPTLMFERYLLRAEASLRFECGDYEEAIKNYENLIELDIANNLKSFVYWYYLFIGESFYFLNRPDKAEQYYEQALHYKEENDEYQIFEYTLHKSILKKKNNIDSKIEMTLLKARKYFAENRILYSKVQIEFHLADLYFRKGQIKTSLLYLSESLNTSSEKQYVSFLEQLFIDSRYLFDLAIANNLQKDFVILILGGVADKLQFKWLSDESKHRISKELDKIYDISLKTFGGIEIFVRGLIVPENKWIRKKSKQILIYLLLNPTLKFTKEKMMDLFFQDLSIESAENLFHQVITNIRNVTYIEYLFSSNSNNENRIKKKRNAKDKINIKNRATEEIKNHIAANIIIYEDKILRLNPDNNYRVDALMFNKLFNTFKSAESDDELKIRSARTAIDLYTGEFLPGYYESWCEEMREYYINKVIELCEGIINILKKKKQYYDMIMYCEKLLQIDKLHEEAYLDIIDTYARIGNINMAKQKFSVMLKVYEQEYGEKPKKNVLDKIQKFLLQ
jgi:LuxR family maltose regulon positive regulatory protein